MTDLEDRIRESLHDPRRQLPVWPDLMPRIRRAARRQRARLAVAIGMLAAVTGLAIVAPLLAVRSPAGGAPGPGTGTTPPSRRSFAAPYAPHPVISYPGSWHVYTALIPGVVMPYDVVVCNRKLHSLPDIEGLPDLRAVPRDATMLVLWLQDPVPVASANLSGRPIRLNGRTMRFSDLRGGQRNWQGFRNFIGWYIATSGDTLYSIGVNVYVGPDAGSEWRQVQPILDSIHLPGRGSTAGRPQITHAGHTR
jgi:hypothetical protein